MTLVLNLRNNAFFILLMLLPLTAAADPEVGGELLPPGEASYVTDGEILKKLNLGPDDEPVWCYSNLANSLLISAADRALEKCSLKKKQEIEELNIRHGFEIDSLKIELNSEKQRNKEILSIKDTEIERLTAAALKRPNDYTVWWVTGGFAAGVVTAVSIFFLTK